VLWTIGLMVLLESLSGWFVGRPLLQHLLLRLVGRKLLLPFLLLNVRERASESLQAAVSDIGVGESQAEAVDAVAV